MRSWRCAWPGHRLPRWNFPSSAKTSCTLTTLNLAPRLRARRLNVACMERWYGTSNRVRKDPAFTLRQAQGKWAGGEIAGDFPFVLSPSTSSGQALSKHENPFFSSLLRTFAHLWTSRGLQRVAAVWLVLSVVLLSGGLDSPAETVPPPEYQLKAVFLFNFAQFVEWPPEAFPEARTPLVIGILGEDPFGAYLDETVRGETVYNRPLTVQRYSQVEETKTCHVLFISPSEA